MAADQPVHCLRGHVYGEWLFHVSEEQTVNLYDIDEVCTHRQPNLLQVIAEDHEFRFASEELYRIELLDEYKAQARYCVDDICDEAIAGTWTTIYDQAFMVELDSGIRFLANFKYSVKPDISEDPISDGDEQESPLHGLNTANYDKFDSVCDKTMIGFVQSIPSVSGER